MKIFKRIAAIALVTLVIVIWAGTFIIAVLGGPQSLLIAFLILSVLVPILIYGILLVASLISGRNVKNIFDKAKESHDEADS